MKYVKVLGLSFAVGAALLALAATASATTLTDKNGGVYLKGTVVKAESEKGILFDGPIEVTCNQADFEATVEKEGGKNENETVEIKLKKMTIADCGTTTVTVVDNGTFIIHTKTAGKADGDGTVTMTGGKFDVLTHNIFLGTQHCIYVTNDTHVGTLTGSKNSKPVAGGHATVDVGPAKVGTEETGALCGEEVEVAVNYTIKAPAYMDVD